MFVSARQAPVGVQENSVEAAAVAQVAHRFSKHARYRTSRNLAPLLTCRSIVSSLCVGGVVVVTFREGGGAGGREPGGVVPADQQQPQHLSARVPRQEGLWRRFCMFVWLTALWPPCARWFVLPFEGAEPIRWRVVQPTELRVPTKELMSWYDTM